MSEQEDSCLEIPEQKIDEAERAAEAAARKLSIPQFCQEIEAAVNKDDTVSDEMKSAVVTMTGLVQHMHMAIHQYVFAKDQLQDLLNITIGVVDKKEAQEPAEASTPTLQ